jgi:type IV fimbrial biogenesis protein FimT
MKKRTQAAFTLMELMVVMSIAGVLLVLTVPNIQSFLKNNKMTGAANDVLTAVTLARNEAIKLQVPVAVCASNNPKAGDGAACSTDAFSGWIVWVDTDNDGLHQAGERIIAAHDAFDASIATKADNQYIVSYAATGFTQPSPGGRAATTQIAICDDRGNTATGGTQSAARAVTINVTGRGRVTRIIGEISAVIASIGTFGSCTG